MPAKQAAAEAFLRRGIAENSIVVPHQALTEFVSAVTRPIADGAPLLTADEAHREVDDMLAQFTIVYPTENTLRTALRGAALYNDVVVRCVSLGVRRRAGAGDAVVRGL